MSATCYFLSGNNADSTGSTYIPCNTTAVANGAHSACCAPNDMCFTNGLCKAPTDDQYNWNWRIGCTDPTFSDPACPNYCQGLESDNAAHVVFQCSDNVNWCCATGNPDNFRRDYNFTCCSDEDLVLNLGTAVYYTQASVSMLISTVESSTTATPSTKVSSTQASLEVQQTSSSAAVAASLTTQPTSTTLSPTDSSAPKQSSTSQSSSTALKAGLGVGISAALVLMGLIAFCFYRMGQRQSRRATQVAQQQQQQDGPEHASSLPIPIHSPAEADHSDSQHDEALLSRDMEADYMHRGHEVELAHQRSPVELEMKYHMQRSPVELDMEYRPSPAELDGRRLY